MVMEQAVLPYAEERRNNVEGPSCAPSLRGRVSPAARDARSRYELKAAAGRKLHQDVD